MRSWSVKLYYNVNFNTDCQQSTWLTQTSGYNLLLGAGYCNTNVTRIVILMFLNFLEIVVCLLRKDDWILQMHEAVAELN